MENAFFSKTNSVNQQNSYFKGWKKALKAYQEVTEEDLKKKFGIYDGKTKLRMEFSTTES